MPLFRSRKPQAGDLARLRSILVRLSELCADSDDSIYNDFSAKEITETLEDQTKRINEGKKISIKTISYLMIPAGPLQDTSIDNDWAQEFLQLSEEFDGIEERAT